MKNVILISIFSIFCFTSCKSDLEKIGLEDMKSNKAFQDSILDKSIESNNNEDFFNKADSVIALYKNLKIENKDNNFNYLYYLLRIYLKINDLKFNNFYDTLNNTFKDQKKYREYYDSGYSYINKALIIEPNNLSAMFFLIYTLDKENRRFFISNDITFSQENNSERFNYIINNVSKFMLNNSEKDKEKIDDMAELTFSIFNYSYFKLNFKYVENDFNRTNILVVLGSIMQRIQNIKKMKLINKEYLMSNIDEINRNISLARNDIERRNKIAAENERLAHLWDNVSADVYKNGGCQTTWVYSNGKYAQELYEQDISTLSYHDQMNISNYDLINCSVENVKKYIKHSSRGSYTKNGSTYYFYPRSPEEYILAGEDDKGRKYMSINSYENMEFYRPNDFQKVVLRLESKNCRTCVTPFN